VLTLLTVILALAPTEARAESAEKLIRQAGNCEDDAQRLEILKQILKSADLDPTLRLEVENLAALVDRWLHDPSLYRWFDREIRRTLDYDFKVRPESPLFPLARFYRGRMLVWAANESGNILGYHEERRKFFDRAVADFRAAQAAFPANRISGMYLGEPIPSNKRYVSPPSAPPWAAFQREGLERLTDIVSWWIDHRLQKDGQYGGGWDDDCEMWRDWVPVMIAFEDPRITRAQAFFSQALLSQPYMKSGYTSRLYDVEHTAEPSKDTITPMMHLAPQDPQWQARARRIADLAETLWTGKNARGFIQFKSTYFSAERVDTSPKRACDTPYCVVAVEPALLLWQRTADPRLGRLFSAWMDTWVEAAARAEHGKPAGVIPAVIRWPDGAVRGPGEHWWDPRHHDEPKLYEWPSAVSMLCDTLLLTWHMTGKEKYLEPLRSMAAIRLKHLKSRSPRASLEGSEDWCGRKLSFLAPTLARYRLLSGSAEFDELLSRDYVALNITASGDRRDALVSALCKTAEALRINFPGYTSEVRFTDRVFTFPRLFGADMLFAEAVPSCNQRPDTRLLYATTTGDRGNFEFFPLNAVRWLTPPRDISALVTESGRDRLQAELYHFGNAPRTMGAEFYLLAPGAYSLTLRSTTGQVIQGPRAFSVEGPRTRITLEIPAAQLCMLKVSRRSP
jgi:hypothetical protein